MKTDEIYYRYSNYLTGKYGEKVYKLPVNLPVSCPNREADGFGCSFCGGTGAGFENRSNIFSVQEQLRQNKDYIGSRYKAKKFIAYFQNFTNTYLPLELFQKYMEEAAAEKDIVELAISTRPDCIRLEYLNILNKIQKEYGIEITIELGLQTVNYHTLIKINRGHTLAEYIEAMHLIQNFKFETCTHLILNLPWDNRTDVIESAKFLSAMGSTRVKLHALYIEKGTQMAEDYEKGKISLCSLEEYEERVILFLEFLSSEIVVERLLGRAPEEETLFANWGQSWWKIRDEIEQKMEQRKSFQGKQFHYLGGKGVTEFFNPC